MKDIFISFSSQDETLAAEATRFMEKRGMSVWRCTRFEDNIPGGNWIQQLVDQLLNCEAVLLLYTVSAGKSKYVARELAMAVDLNKPIVVVKLDDSPFPRDIAYFLTTLQVLDGQGVEPSVWLPKACKSLDQFIKRESLIPMDSITDRNIKVEMIHLLWDKHFGQQPVYIHGVGILIENMAHEFLKQPYMVSLIYNNAQHVLSEMTILTQDISGCCIVPFLVKENVMLLVAMTASEGLLEQMENIMFAVPDIIQEAVSAEYHGNSKMPGLDLKIIKGDPICWKGDNNLDEIANFLTFLGNKKGNIILPEKELTDETNDFSKRKERKIDIVYKELIKELAARQGGIDFQTKINGPGIDIVYQELIKEITARQGGIDFQLPRALTGFTAKTHLEAILDSGK